MREIKFRGRRLYFNGRVGEWVFGSLSIMLSGHTFIIDHARDWIYEVEPDSVGEYTGLKDCYGSEIYEGDVLADYEGVTAEVKYEGSGFVARFKNDSVELVDVNETWELIGNVHDGIIAKG